MTIITVILTVLSTLPAILPAVADLLKALGGFLDASGNTTEEDIGEYADAAAALVLDVEGILPDVMKYVQQLYPGLTEKGLAKLVYVRDNLMKDFKIDAHTATTHAQLAVMKMKLAPAVKAKLGFAKGTA